MNVLLRRLPAVVANRPLGSSGNPESSGAGRSCNADQEDWVTAGSRDPCDRARKARVTMRAKGNCGGVENGLCLVSGIADQRAGDCTNWTWRPTENCSVDYKPLDLKRSGSGREVHARMAAAGVPGECSAVNIANWVVNVRGRD